MKATNADTTSDATEELLRIPGFEEAFRRAVQQVEDGQVVRFEDIRRFDEEKSDFCLARPSDS
jgi:hypothetical protein